MSTKDYFGLNIRVYDAIEGDSGSFGQTNTLGFNESTKNTYWYNRGGLADDSTDTLSSLNLHRNGPYGFPIFKQVRISDNHLSRYHKKNNIMTVCLPDEQREITVNGKNLLIEERFGDIERFVEPPLVTCYYPININLGQYVGSDDQKYLEKFGLSFDYSNNITYFSDPRLNDILELGELDDDVYEKIKELYLNGALESPNSEISYFEFLRYQQTIFPRQENAFKSYVRTRPNYTNTYWRDLRADRNEYASNGFGTTVSQSIWNLDGDENFTTRSGSNQTNAPFNVSASHGWKYTNYARFSLGGDVSGSFSQNNGILQNNYNHFFPYYSNLLTSSVFIDTIKKPAPIYARRHTLHKASGSDSNFFVGWNALSSSVVNPFSSYAIHILSSESMGPIYQGDAVWEAGRFSGKNPAYDTYGAFFDDLRGLGKDFSTVPEYRMSDFVAKYLESGSLVKIDEIFKMEGGLEGSADSSEGIFYKTYSTTDFMRHFAEIKEDHEGFTDPSLITLKCKALKKFLAYDGFYPAQRTLALTEQFDAAYGERIKRYSSENDYNYSKQYVYDALFAPGVLYNTIKSGIAVDYPIISNQTFERTETTNGYLIKSDFDRRIPFESLVDPNNFLNGITFRNNSPEDTAFDGYDKTTYFRRRNAAPLYYKMANNFFAESIDFFLKNGQLTTLYSLPQGSDNFGNFIGGDTYGMRVFMNIDSDTAFALYTGNTASFQPPQMTVTGTNGVDFEMYSRPSAFGPPVLGSKTFTSLRFNITGTLTSGRVMKFSVDGTEYEIGTFTPGVPPLFQDFNVSNTGNLADNHSNAERLQAALRDLLDNEFGSSYDVFTVTTGRAATGFQYKVVMEPTGSTQTLAAGSSTFTSKFTLVTGSAGSVNDAFNDSRTGFNPVYTPPYYYGQCWVDMVFNPTQTKKYTISEIINEITASAIRFDSQVFSSSYFSLDQGPLRLNTTTFSGSDSDLIPGPTQTFFNNEYAISCSSNTYLNINSNQLYSSLNLFGRAVKQDEFVEGGTKRITTFSTTELSDPNARWVIQPKFETPMPTFRRADLDSARGYIPTTASANQANGQTPRGMWHQYGVFAKDGHGVDIGVMDIPNNWLREYNLLAPGSVTFDGKMRSLRSAIGFINDDTILGKTRASKTVSEAVVAIPYVEEDTIKKFFQIKDNNFQAALNYFKAGDLISQGIDPSSVGLVNQDFWEAKTSRSVIDQIVKMKRYVLPPVFDAITYDEVTPIAMYIFEFKHTFDAQDILDIWQNLPPKIGESFETAEASISHPLLANELMGGGDGDDDSRTGAAMPDNVRWMVFKVKQKAKTNYYSKIASNSNSFAADFDTEEDPVTFNWPYDFFSLVELIKIDAEIEFSDIDYDVNVEAQDPSESSGDTTSAAVGRRRRVKLKAKRPISREQAKEQSQSLSKKRVRTKNKYKK